jgi:hypothetical protein
LVQVAAFRSQENAPAKPFFTITGAGPVMSLPPVW